MAQWYGEALQSGEAFEERIAAVQSCPRCQSSSCRGTGGMGVVYEGLQPTIGKRVAKLEAEPARPALDEAPALALCAFDPAVAAPRPSVVLRWNGSGWAPDPSGTVNNLGAIWGSGPADLRVVGTHATILEGP